MSIWKKSSTPRGNFQNLAVKMGLNFKVLNTIGFLNLFHQNIASNKKTVLILFISLNIYIFYKKNSSPMKRDNSNYRLTCKNVD